MIWVKDWAFSFYLRVESGIIGLVSDRFCDRPSDMESKTFVITVAVVNRNLVDISMTRRWDSVFVAYRIRLYKYRNSLIHSPIFTKWFWGHLLLVARIRRFNQLNPNLFHVWVTLHQDLFYHSGVLNFYFCDFCALVGRYCQGHSWIYSDSQFLWTRSERFAQVSVLMSRLIEELVVIISSRLV